jgi:hypothetical protein
MESLKSWTLVKKTTVIHLVQVWRSYDQLMMQGSSVSQTPDQKHLIPGSDILLSAIAWIFWSFTASFQTTFTCPLEVHNKLCTYRTYNDVQHKIIHKRSSKKKGNFLLIFAEIVENQTLNFWKNFIVPTIGLLLQTHNTMCILHAIVEILEN